jgi:hypothetical protein
VTSWGLTFELSGRQRQDASARTEKKYRVPQSGRWWPAVGAPLERGVRPHSATQSEEAEAREALEYVLRTPHLNRLGRSECPPQGSDYMLRTFHLGATFMKDRSTT